MSTSTYNAVVGVKDFVYAALTANTDTATVAPAYGTVYSIPGINQANYNANGSLTRLYGDDGVFAAAETTGDQTLSIDLADIPDADKARLLGHTYANGALSQSSSDTSPYVAVGFKLSLDNGAYRYVWFAKVKFSKLNQDATTKESSVSYQTQMMEGAILNLTYSGVYRVSARSDDNALPAATLSGWFNAPVISTSVDTTAMTLVVTAGAGATTTLLFTFSKASASASYPFTMSTATITDMANSVEICKASDGSRVATTYALLSAGTGLANSTITVTATTGLSNTAVYVIAPNPSSLKDNSGVCVTEYYSGSVTTRT